MQQIEWRRTKSIDETTAATIYGTASCVSDIPGHATTEVDDHG